MLDSGPHRCPTPPLVEAEADGGELPFWYSSASAWWGAGLGVAAGWWCSLVFHGHPWPILAFCSVATVWPVACLGVWIGQNAVGAYVVSGSIWCFLSWTAAQLPGLAALYFLASYVVTPVVAGALFPSHAEHGGPSNGSEAPASARFSSRAR